MESKFQQRAPQTAGTGRPNLTGIPTQMKLDFEQRSGMTFDDVRVHYNSDKPAQFHALAYTQGDQIYIGPGQERSLSHELGHVIQQKAGRVRPTRWIRGQPVNDQPELEREADRAPVQCMQAPALWGVIQMYLPVLPRQRGNNCGYHALARAIYALCQNKFTNQFTENNLEIQLTTYAIEHGYSAIGEAFDPFALAEVGNSFCHDIICTVHIFDESTLDTIQRDIQSGNIVFLVPYFPAEHSQEPTNNTAKKENAHWCVIGKGDNGLLELCEGNSLGSAGFGCRPSEYLGVWPNGNSKPLSNKPVNKSLRKVELTTLLESNRSINPIFNWTQFLVDTGLQGINNDKMAVVTNQNCKKFNDSGDFYDQVRSVMEKIDSLPHNIDLPNELLPSLNTLPPPNLIQNIHLNGFVIKVKKAQSNQKTCCLI